MQWLGNSASSAARTLIVAALGVSALLLLAFGPRATDDFPPDRVIVDYWAFWTGAEEAGMRRIVNAFNDTVGKEKRIFVRYLSTSAIQQKTLVATAAGAPPDVAALYDQDVPQFAALDALEPLGPLATEHGIVAAKYKPAFWNVCHYEGELYGLPATAFDLALFYNKSMFQRRASDLRAAGLDPDRPPRTIAELDAYAQALDVKDSAGRLEIAGFLPLEPGWFQRAYCLWFGGRRWDESARRFTFTDPSVVKAYQWIQSYSQRHGADNETSFRSGVGSYDSPENSFLSGRVAMVFQGAFFSTVIETQKPSMAGQWGVAPFPSADAQLTNVTFCNSDVLVIPRGARHKTEAFEFIAFVQRQEMMEGLAQSHGKISPLANVSESFLRGHRNPHIRVFDELAASPNAHGSEPIPILNEVNDEMNSFVQRLAMMTATPEQGLADMQDRLQRKYDEFAASQRARQQLKNQDDRATQPTN